MTFHYFISRMSAGKIDFLNIITLIVNVEEQYDSLQISVVQREDMTFTRISLTKLAT